MKLYKHFILALSTFLGLELKNNNAYHHNVKNEIIDNYNDLSYISFDDYLVDNQDNLITNTKNNYNIDIKSDYKKCNNLFNKNECLTNFCNWCFPSNELINFYQEFEGYNEYDNYKISLFTGECLSNKETNTKLLNKIYNCDNFFENKFFDNKLFDNKVINDRHNISYFYDFNKFINKYNKKYNDQELYHKFITFSNNLYKIKTHEFNFKLDINEFADLSEDEFKGFIKNTFLNSNDEINKIKTKNGLRITYNKRIKPLNKVVCKPFSSSKNSSSLLNEIDWRQLGAVTVPKDQGKCGSCWSFSASGAMEGAWAIKHGQLISLSEQHLIDCSTKYNNNGCQGGLMDNAFEYVIDSGGMCSESEVPYEAKQHLFCKQCNYVMSISSCVDVTPNNQLHLKEAVNIGPVSVAIEADTSVFQFYSGGVIDSVKCGNNLDHGVLIVGYGNENGKDYWLVKNSWGINWGDGGFVKIGRSSSVDDEGICGIAMQPSYPVV